MGFIFGGDTGIDYETLQRRRAVSDAMQARGTGLARNAGEGIGMLGNAVFGKILSNRLDKQEAQGRKSASEAFEKAFAASRQRRAQAQAPQPTPAATGQIETQPLAPPDALRSDVMKALIHQESGGNPSAVSPKGAGGLAQIMPATARDPGYGVPTIYDLSAQMGGSTPPPPEAGDEAMTAWLSDPKNAAINERFGGLYLDAMTQKNGGNRDLALASYNAGPGAVEKHGGIPPYEETQNYVKAINDRLGKAGQTPSQSAPEVAAPEPIQGIDSISPELLQLAGNQYLSPQQQQVVSALLQQQIGALYPEQMSPYQSAQLDLQERRFAAQLDGRLKTGNTVNVNTGSNGIDYGKPPTDMAWVRNPDGKVRLDERGVPMALPIDGSKLGAAAEKVEKADAAREEGKQKTAGIQFEEITRAKAKINESPTWTTGFLGDVLKDWGGTEAKDVSALLETIQANIGFDRLNQMRAESPTGGALGNVTERELKFLQSVAGSLDQAQSAEQLLENLSRLEAEIGKIVHGPDWSPNGQDDDDVSDLLEKY